MPNINKLMILAYGERMPRVLFVAVFYVVAELTNGFVADLTAVVAELDVADSTCRRVGCRRLDLSPT